MTPEERAREIAKAMAGGDCGDCPCPKELGGPGFCVDLCAAIGDAIRSAEIAAHNAAIEACAQAD